jgi:hypothetical protein
MTPTLLLKSSHPEDLKVKIMLRFCKVHHMTMRRALLFASLAS